MLGTYVSLALILGASAAVGQALFGLCGRHEWSWLSPAIGLSLLCAVAFGGAHLGGDAIFGLAAVAALTVGGGFILQRQGFTARAEPAALSVLLGGLILGSVPFLVELRFGILGTALNPDMSQHLFAADRLLSGGTERLVEEGYPLGPHALVASVSKLGPSLVHGFGGLTIAIAISAAVAPLGYLRELAPERRAIAALIVGFSYMVASFLIQGAFKETFEAMIVLVFAIGLAELASGDLGGADPAGRWRRLRAVPLAALAVGAVYAYSFPGLAWLVGALAIWALAWLVRVGRPDGQVLGPAGAALVFFGALVALEVPRMIDFARFETFDPDGAGLGNLFNPLSPIEALGVWPSGDFRLDAGAGAIPALVFYAGGALALVALVLGAARTLRRGELAVPAAAVAGVALYAYAVVSGTPYQEAKALVVVAPLLALLAVPAALSLIPAIHELREAPARELPLPLAGLAFVVAAAGCSALALVNGPVGPSKWSPALTEFNGQIGDEPVLAVASQELIDQNGYDLIAWELRGHEVCVATEREAASSDIAQRSYGAVVVIGELESPLPVVGRLEEVAERDGYALFDAKLAGPDPDCPFIADGDRAAPGTD